MQGLTEGRIVHYVLDSGPHQGEHRPAIVVKVWNKDTGYVNLQAIFDGTNDLPDHLAGALYWVTSVEYSEEPRPRTWHWIEQA